MNALDVYLQPHSDDVCFSLGALARRRGGGMLLTVFPLSDYVAAPGEAASSAETITATRKAEDEAFARGCGFALRSLGLPSSSLLGRAPFDLSGLAEATSRCSRALWDVLLAPPPPAERPWLFCPAGVGGHVDHVAVFEAILARYAEIAARYRVAFYEDLHYASKSQLRRRGLTRLFERTPGLALRRSWHRLDADDVGQKLAAIRLYSSQFSAPPQDLKRFSPAAASRRPHEALWSEEAFPAGGTLSETLAERAARRLPASLRRFVRQRAAGRRFAP